MASLKLTPEEKKLSSVMEFDDAAVGMITKRVIAALGNGCKITDTDTLFVTACAQIFITSAIKINATDSSITLRDLYNGDEQLGDWEISINQIKAPMRESNSQWKKKNL